MQRTRTFGLALVLATAIVPFAPSAHAAGIVGAEDDEEEEDDEKPSPKPAVPSKDSEDAKDSKDAKGKNDKAKDESKGKSKSDDAKNDKAKGETKSKGDDEKSVPEKGGKPDAAKPDAAKPAGAGKAKPVDVLAPDAEDEKRAVRERKDAEARAAANAAAEKAAREAEEQRVLEKKRADEEKKAAEIRRHDETREQRLVNAKSLRRLTRKAGAYTLQVSLEPGAAAANQLLEVRVRVEKKLDVADPRFGFYEPMNKVRLVANVRETTGRDALGRSYALHALDTPGTYGFHTTPPRDGLVQVALRGKTPDGTSIDVVVPVHVGTWPAPDFDEEEKNNAALRTDTGRAARAVGGED